MMKQKIRKTADLCCWRNKAWQCVVGEKEDGNAKRRIRLPGSVHDEGVTKSNRETLRNCQHNGSLSLAL